MRPGSFLHISSQWRRLSLFIIYAGPMVKRKPFSHAGSCRGGMNKKTFKGPFNSMHPMILWCCFISCKLDEPSNKGYNFLCTSRNTVLKSFHTKNSVKLQAQDTVLFPARVIQAALAVIRAVLEEPKSSENTVLSVSRDTQTADWAKAACKCHELQLPLSKKFQHSPDTFHIG